MCIRESHKLSSCEVVMTDHFLVSGIQVYEGEAPESDDEITETSEIEASRLDNSQREDLGEEITEELQQTKDSRGSHDNIVQHRSPEGSKYNSLLHSRLREANTRLEADMLSSYSRELEGATKNLTTTTQQLTKTKALIQDASNTMRMITNSLFYVEDKINIVSSCTLLPDITLPS